MSLGLNFYLIDDGGSNAHVCNSKSAHLYTKSRDARSEKHLGSGTKKIQA